MNKIDMFHPFTLHKDLTLKNRVVMAPLTRSKADDNLIPTEEMAAYYARRADAGLIISEATLIAQEGQGYPNGPGLYTQAQIDGWKRITQRVHQNGGKIFAQIWHTGRVSHSIYHNGERPIAPSAIGLNGRVVMQEGLNYETPRAMTHDDIERVIELFAHAAKNALDAGFDGVEIHGANGYLIDQFLHYASNQRDDHYGGTKENMTRFLIRILDAIKAVIPENSIGLRLSPHTGINEEWQVMEHDGRDTDVFAFLLTQLNHYNLAYIHKGMYDDYYVPYLEGTSSQFIRRYYNGNIIACGGYDIETGRQVIEQGDADLIAIGRPFIANHDLVERMKNNTPIKSFSFDMLDTLY